MCVSHAQISYFHSPYVMQRMQNGGSGSVSFGRAFMSCVEETRSKRYKVELQHHLPPVPAQAAFTPFLPFRPKLRSPPFPRTEGSP